MNVRLFYTVLVGGILVVIVEGVISWATGWLTQSQLRAREVTGYSFMEHGGMWADVFIVSPLVAYIMSKYQLAYFSKRGWVILALATLVSFVAGYAYQKLLVVPEVFVHDGKTSVVGWIHGLFAISAIWIIVLFYIDPSAT